MGERGAVVNIGEDAVEAPVVKIECGGRGGRGRRGQGGRGSGNVNFVATCRLGVTGDINGVGFRPTDNDIHGLSLDKITYLRQTMTTCMCIFSAMV